MTPAQVGELVAFLASHYPTWKPPANTVAAWSLSLAKADPSTILASARRHAVTEKWPPSIAELLEGAQAGDPIPDPESVVREILKAVRDTPGLELPRGLSPIAQDVVDCIGWNYITDSENPTALRAQLLKLATTYRKRHVNDAAFGATETGWDRLVGELRRQGIIGPGDEDDA